jgi:hypothetical protein
VKPVKIELTDAKTKQLVDTLEVDACLVATGRAPYTQVNATWAREIYPTVPSDLLKSSFMSVVKSS